MSGADSYYHSEAEKFFQEAYQKQTDGQLEEAIQLYKKSIELFPTAEAHTFLGWAYSFKGLYEDAIRECHAAIKIDPEYGNPYNDIGAYLIDKNKLDEAIPWLEKAMNAKRYESYCYPYYNLGRVWERKGNWFMALEYYNKSLKENPDYHLAKRAVSRLQGMMN
jgi:tetratricopeptide (TPR) repeat protein